MRELRKITLCLTIASVSLGGIVGCQSGARFAMFGQPKPVAEAESTAVTQTAAAEERIESSFNETATASGLGGTSISHVLPHRPKSTTRGNERPRVGGPHAGSAMQNY